MSAHTRLRVGSTHVELRDTHGTWEKYKKTELRSAYDEDGLRASARSFGVGHRLMKQALAAAGVVFTQTRNTRNPYDTWKGTNGYWNIKIPQTTAQKWGISANRNATIDGFCTVALADYLLCEHEQRPLGPDEFAHHKNMDIDDNRIENLERRSRSDHGAWHHGQSEAANEERLVTGYGWQRIGDALVRPSAADSVRKALAGIPLLPT